MRVKTERVTIVTASEMAAAAEVMCLAHRARSDARGMAVVILDAHMIDAMLFGSGYVRFLWESPS